VLKDAFAVVIETWTAEVHAGQRLSGDVMRFMHDCGFALFETSVAAAWKRSGCPETVQLGGKVQLIGLDLLFLKEAARPAREPGTALKAIKAAAIAEVYGYPEYAYELLTAARLRHSESAAVIEQLRDRLATNAQARKIPTSRFQQRWRRYFGEPVVPEFAPLH